MILFRSLLSFHNVEKCLRVIRKSVIAHFINAGIKIPENTGTKYRIYLR